MDMTKQLMDFEIKSESEFEASDYTRMATEEPKGSPEPQQNDVETIPEMDSKTNSNEEEEHSAEAAAEAVAATDREKATPPTVQDVDEDAAEPKLNLIKDPPLTPPPRPMTSSEVVGMRDPDDPELRLQLEAKKSRSLPVSPQPQASHKLAAAALFEFGQTSPTTPGKPIKMDQKVTPARRRLPPVVSGGSGGGATDNQQFCLRWNNYQSNLTNVFDELLQSESFVDVTLSCEGQSIKAHKMVLSACSPYFQALFYDNPCQHPIIIMRDVHWSDLKALVEFMYKGEINVCQDQINPLLKVAETLKIRGLAEVSAGASRDGASAHPMIPDQRMSVYGEDEEEDEELAAAILRQDDDPEPKRARLLADTAMDLNQRQRKRSRDGNYATPSPLHGDSLRPDVECESSPRTAVTPSGQSQPTSTIVRNPFASPNPQSLQAHLLAGTGHSSSSASSSSSGGTSSTGGTAVVGNSSSSASSSSAGTYRTAARSCSPPPHHQQHQHHPSGSSNGSSSAGAQLHSPNGGGSSSGAQSSLPPHMAAAVAAAAHHAAAAVPQQPQPPAAMHHHAAAAAAQQLAAQHQLAHSHAMASALAAAAAGGNGGGAASAPASGAVGGGAAPSASSVGSSHHDDMEIKPEIAEMIREEERAKMIESGGHGGWMGAAAAATGASVADSYQYQLQSMWQKCWNTNQQNLVQQLRFRERGPLKSWRPEAMAEAIFSVLKEGLSLSQAARKFDIPYPTFVLYANRVHNMLGPSLDGGTDPRPKARGRPQRILLGMWPEELIRSVIKAVVFRDYREIKEDMGAHQYANGQSHATYIGGGTTTNGYHSAAAAKMAAQNAALAPPDASSPLSTMTESLRRQILSQQQQAAQHQQQQQHQQQAPHMYKSPAYLQRSEIEDQVSAAAAVAAAAAKHQQSGGNVGGGRGSENLPDLTALGLMGLPGLNVLPSRGAGVNGGGGGGAAAPSSAASYARELTRERERDRELKEAMQARQYGNQSRGSNSSSKAQQSNRPGAASPYSTHYAKQQQQQQQVQHAKQEHPNYAYNKRFLESLPAGIDFEAIANGLLQKSVQAQNKSPRFEDFFPGPGGPQDMSELFVNPDAAAAAAAAAAYAPVRESPLMKIKLEQQQHATELPHED
ncbi:protein bric-a-brac 2 isoform X2 [Drosophila subobscura]|uniref:protein bric-a-brac 2 isoform X2 n=1 Tax=Drosophila subobscura TaxID=7241 RepID=UPI00155A0926|nr:protein bric-a-brac 2 isoform X2 [Drosophila subobscura]